jgi:hypothetical protein
VPVGTIIRRKDAEVRGVSYVGVHTGCVGAEAATIARAAGAVAGATAAGSA